MADPYQLATLKRGWCHDPQRVVEVDNDGIEEMNTEERMILM